MTPDRWEQINRLYYAALEVETKERARFLEESCPGDSGLRAEVETLLAMHEKAGEFLARPALEEVARQIPEEPPSLVGRQLGPYQILGLLGSGGMGEVYRARDNRLNRTVAIKVIPKHLSERKDLRQRFEREARAIAGLNHPNICAVYDIGSHEGVDFLVMEHLEGERLSERLKKGPLPFKQLLQVAMEITSALEQAHRRGVVHRDLKPGNIMLTEGGAKLLDFGLAKQTGGAGALRALSLPNARQNARSTMESLTEEGMILGTVEYMAPEQVEGKEADARSDIFALGTVIYEMATGRRAFEGKSQASLMAAILTSQPVPMTRLQPQTPPALEHVVQRCLAKNPDQRWQSAHDLANELKQIAEGQPRLRMPKRWRAVLGAGVLAGVAAIAVGVWWLTQERPQLQPVVLPLTTFPGEEVHPSFSPDGNQVAFAWNGPKQDNFDIYVKQIGTESMLHLTSDPGHELYPAWSPDGRSIAFLRDLSGGKFGVFLIPAIGGPARKLCETRFADRLAWSPDGKWLAFTDLVSASPSREACLYALSVETGERHKLTSGPTFIAGFEPAFSPDGRNLVFRRQTNWGHAELYLMALRPDLNPAGEPKQITFQGGGAAGPVWTPDGREIVCIIYSKNSSELWRISLSGSRTPRRLDFAGDHVEQVALSRQGNRLAYVRDLEDSNIWRLDLHGPGGKATHPTNLISSTWNELVPQYSPDGRRIAFISGRSGHHEVWVCESDGSNPLKLTSMQGQETGSPHWSPDGKRIVFDSSTIGNFEVYVIDADGGAPTNLTRHPADDALASFSHDGRLIYFVSDRSGRYEIWKMSAEGGEAIQITRNGAFIPAESPDGRYLYYKKEGSLWRLPSGGGEEERIVEKEIHTFALTASGVYFFWAGRPGIGNSIDFLDLSTRKETTVATIPRESGDVSVSPDERYLLYTQVDQSGSDLMLVENFR